MRDPTTAAVALSSAHGIGTVRVEPVNNCKLGTACPSSPELLLGRNKSDVINYAEVECLMRGLCTACPSLRSRYQPVMMTCYAAHSHPLQCISVCLCLLAAACRTRASARVTHLCSTGAHDAQQQRARQPLLRRGRRPERLPAPAPALQRPPALQRLGHRGHV